MFYSDAVCPHNYEQFNGPRLQFAKLKFRLTWILRNSTWQFMQIALQPHVFLFIWHIRNLFANICSGKIMPFCGIFFFFRIQINEKRTKNMIFHNTFRSLAAIAYHFDWKMIICVLTWHSNFSNFKPTSWENRTKHNRSYFFVSAIGWNIRPCNLCRLISLHFHSNSFLYLKICTQICRISDIFNSIFHTIPHQYKKKHTHTHTSS